MGGAYSTHPASLSGILLANKRLMVVLQLKSYIVYCRKCKQMRNSYKILVGKFEGIIPRCKWENKYENT
jgi:hypothetical protein